jgi:hypothetical protein
MVYKYREYGVGNGGAAAIANTNFFYKSLVGQDSS